MRPIKFRAWDKQVKRVFTLTNLGLSELFYAIEGRLFILIVAVCMFLAAFVPAQAAARSDPTEGVNILVQAKASADLILEGVVEEVECLKAVLEAFEPEQPITKLVTEDGFVVYIYDWNLEDGYLRVEIGDRLLLALDWLMYREVQGRGISLYSIVLFKKWPEEKGRTKEESNERTRGRDREGQ